MKNYICDIYNVNSVNNIKVVEKSCGYSRTNMQHFNVENTAIMLNQTGKLEGTYLK